MVRWRAFRSVRVARRRSDFECRVFIPLEEKVTFSVPASRGRYRRFLQLYVLKPHCIYHGQKERLPAQPESENCDGKTHRCVAADYV